MCGDVSERQHAGHGDDAQHQPFNPSQQPSNRWFFRRVPKIPRSGDVKTLPDETNSSAHAELFLVFKTCLGERGGVEPPNECVSVLTRYNLSISGPDPEVFCSHRPTHLMNSTYKAFIPTHKLFSSPNWCDGCSYATTESYRSLVIGSVHGCEIVPCGFWHQSHRDTS